MASAFLESFRARLFAAVLSLAALTPAPPAIPQTPEVDLALVLAIDCSFSVDTDEFRLQMQGLGQALQDPLVWDAIRRGPNQKIAITVFQWSDNDNQRVVLPWITLASPQTTQQTGATLANMSRRLAEGGTSITNALLFSETLFDTAPNALRQVVDLSTDGRNNIGAPLRPVRDKLVANNITINALVIINEFPTLSVYAENQIVGGDGNFVIVAKNYDDFGAAMLRKLIKEIVGPGMT